MLEREQPRDAEDHGHAAGERQDQTQTDGGLAAFFGQRATEHRDEDHVVHTQDDLEDDEREQRDEVDGVEQDVHQMEGRR